MIWLIVGVVVLWSVGVAAAIAGSVDAATQPRELWVMAGERRTVWLWQFVAAVAVPVALAYSGIYFLRVRPKLARADVAHHADADWLRGRRWYHRLNPAWRSPSKWTQAAGRWWAWLLIVAAAAGIVVEQLVQFGRDSSAAPSRGGLALLIGLWGLLGLTSAARAGFWYAEHMRLSGRRPAAGGRLRPRSHQAGD